MPSRKIPALWIFIFLLSACAGSSPKGEGAAQVGAAIEGADGNSGSATSEQYGPALSEAAGPVAPGEAAVAPAPAIESAPPPVVAPLPAAQEPKLCLILGPGMAKAMAEATVLEAIKKANIPVHCVVGTEMGAVVGALYSQAGGSANALQWQLFKLNKENYFSFPLISLREPKASGRKLNDFLSNAFRGKRIEELPIRFATLGMDLDRDLPIAFEKGNVAEALSATLAMPGIFDPWQIAGEPIYSGAVRSPAPMELARKMGGNFLVLIDVLEDSGNAPSSEPRFQKAFSPVRNLIRLQKKDASFVITVPAGNIPFDDFNRQGEVLAAGTKAAEASVPALKAAWEKFQSGAH